MDPYKIIKCPLSTEKSIRLMEKENKLIFVVDLKANKPEIKKAIEELLNMNPIQSFHSCSLSTKHSFNHSKRSFDQYPDF